MWKRNNNGFSVNSRSKQISRGDLKGILVKIPQMILENIRGGTLF